MDEEIQRLAWENHGFRTEVSGTGADEDHFGVPHLAAEITQVAAMPATPPWRRSSPRCREGGSRSAPGREQIKTPFRPLRRYLSCTEWGFVVIDLAIVRVC